MSWENDNLTIEQKKLSAKNKYKAQKYFGIIDEHGKLILTGYVLHHKDISLRLNNVDRYIEWRIDDLELMTKSEHSKLHYNADKLTMSGKNQTEETKRKIGAANALKTRTAAQKEVWSKTTKDWFKNCSDEWFEDWRNKNSISHSKPIYVYDKDMHLIGVYRNRKYLKEELLGVLINKSFYLNKDILYKNMYYFKDYNVEEM